jgi:hypothetical protein
MKAKKPPNPLLGIWWDSSQQIVIVAHGPDKQTAVQAGMLDSELTHAEEWPKIAKKLGRSSADDYFIVPRGRVLHELKTGRAVIYHGNATSTARLVEIAEAFQLTNWVGRLDDHYSTGESIDALFE